MNTTNSSAATDWHIYYHGADLDDFEDIAPKAGYVYQHDATNDTYYSILSNQAAISLLEQVKAGKKLDPARLQHFTDEQSPILTKLLKCDWLASKDDNAKETLAFVAYRHHLDFEHPSIATLIFSHLYGMGANEEDIVSFIENTDEIEDQTDLMDLLRAAKQKSAT